jgi:hypothetical protein
MTLVINVDEMFMDSLSAMLRVSAELSNAEDCLDVPLIGRPLTAAESAARSSVLGGIAEVRRALESAQRRVTSALDELRRLEANGSDNQHD